MSTPFSQFCDQVVRRVRWFPARGSIAAELRAHLEDHAAALMERGTPEEEATQQAVAAMGDPEALGRQLNRAHPPLLCFSVLVTKSSWRFCSPFSALPWSPDVECRCAVPQDREP